MARFYLLRIWARYMIKELVYGFGGMFGIMLTLHVVLSFRI